MNIEDVKEPEGSGTPSPESEVKPEERPIDMGSTGEPAHQEATSEVKKSKKKMPWLVWVLIVLVIILGGWLAYAKFGDQLMDKLLGPLPSSTVDTNITANSVNNTATIPTVAKVVDSGVTWKAPVKLADLGLFAATPESDNMMGGFGGVTYYSVGVNSNGAEIIVAEINIGIGSPEIHRFLKSPVGVYTRLAKNSHELATDLGYSYSGFTDDTSTFFKSLAADKTISNGETILTYQFDGAITATDGYTAGTKVDDTKWGELKVEKGADAGESVGTVKVSRYYIKLNDSTKAYYSVKPTFLRDDGTFNATFTDSSKKAIAFDMIKTSGCGNGVGSFPMVVSAAAMAGKVEAASTSGSKIYTFNDASNSLVNFGYKVYQTGQGTVKPVATFMSDLGLVIWTDAYGSTITYSNKAYSPLAECGKPVIYLYPTTDTLVLVKVGADVTKSEPFYGNGWQALATPSGVLKVAGKSYDSLFWEGIGKGQYPQINSGVVVPAEQAVARIKSDLSTVGLNNKEISDFLTFWEPKLPKTGFTRLSWFFNEDMNKLAPLKVTPAPESVVRVFLDFSPVDAGTTIPAQTLPTYARNGFTLVEWGGLLRR